MAEWKKIITSGSAAELASVTASFSGSGASLQFTDTAAATGDSLVFIDSDGKAKRDSIADVVTLLSGDGIKNGSNKFAVDVSDFAGTGLSGDGSENINIDSNQDGNISSILTTDLKLGEDAQTKIDFETVNEIHFDVNNAELLNLAGSKISGSGISTGSFGQLVLSGGTFTSASLASAVAREGDITGVTAGNGLTGGGSSGGVSLAVGAGTGIDVSSGAVAVDVSDFMTNGSNNRIVTATGTDGMNAEANLTFDGTTLTVAGNLTVNGTTTTVNTTNTLVTDRFMFLNSGSSTGDGGIVVSNGIPNSGSAFAFDDSANRWGFSGSVGQSDSSITPDAYASAVVTSDAAYYRKNGNIRVQSGEIYIYVE